ncbi:MAG TPA: hypothetical protein VEX70_16445 [Pyrinomonadaceae bacterium]|nr:hypothetical protein [Pyrinomonadaceae bacterium]
MRRLAKHSREDQYATRRDYQRIERHPTLQFKLSEPNSRIVLEAEIEPDESLYMGFGGYIKPSSSCEARVSLVVDDEVKREMRFTLSSGWNRIGLAADYDSEERVVVTIEIEGRVKDIEIWGLDFGVLNLPDKMLEGEITLEDIESIPICPETFYLPHEQVLNLEIKADLSSPIHLKEMPEGIELKKCSYCGRHLPLDSEHPGALAFHKHNAKLTGHQNECRSCKKWRINDSFNPARTVDQLHESSVITRERKLLLREPEILQAIKDRHGAGLKSIVWERFGRQCFNCGKPLKLKEVRLDHTRPLAALWPIDEYATCLCETCNGHKTDRFPVDFYSDEQLHRLSKITGLPYKELIKKEVNQKHLQDIINDISNFARTWEARTFNSTARKVRELRPDINLFEILQRDDTAAYEKVISELSTRADDDSE